jgi:hypothetical protein
LLTSRAILATSRPPGWALLKMHIIVLCLLVKTIYAALASPEQLASQYGLTTSTSMPYPSASQSTNDTQDYLIADWSLSKGHIENGNTDLAFVADPFPASGNLSDGSPVLQVTYPAGSFSHDTGGAQFINLWNSSSSPFQSMMVRLTCC